MLAVWLGLALGVGPAAADDPINTTFVILNETGYHPAQIHVKFLGAEIGAAGATPQTYGEGHALETGASTASRSYSLFDMMATLPDTTSYATTPVPTFALHDYVGGRIYFSIGGPLGATTPPAAGIASDPDYGRVYQYAEPFVDGSTSTQTGNIDVSYVDFVGFPVDIAAKNADGTLYSYPTGRNPQVSASGSTMFDHLIASGVPASAIAPALVGGTARIASPSLGGVTGYHDWSALFTYLESVWAAPIPVASYTVPAGQPLASVDFGYVGGGVAVDPYDPTFLLAQDYAFTAHFVSDLNPGGANPRLPHLEGIPGIELSGTGGPYGATTGTGEFDIYIEKTDFDAPAAVYGNNPVYTVDWSGRPAMDGGPIAFPASTGIVNDLTGRIVGDLLAGITFGWAGNDTDLATHAMATATTLPDVFTESRIGDLGTGKYFYLLSLQDDTVDLAEWFGSSISSTPDYYDTYGDAFAADTTAYTMPFGDRLQGSLTPSIWWENSTLGAQHGYIEIKLLPGAYTVPEPGSTLLSGSVCLALGALARRRAARSRVLAA